MLLNNINRLMRRNKKKLKEMIMLQLQMHNPFKKILNKDLQLKTLLSLKIWTI